MRLIHRSLATALFLTLCVLQARADEARTYSGQPVILDSGSMLLDGTFITLWGIDTLAGDQYCWRGNRPWRCGEQATFALQHVLDGAGVRCVTKHAVSTNKIEGQCFSHKGQQEKDIAAFLVQNGWALATDKMDPSPYTPQENEAMENERNIWTSKFQTAEDWREGIQSFINDEEKAEQP